MSDSAATHNTRPRDASRVLELLDQVERDVSAIRDAELDLEQRELMIAKREEDMAERMATHRANLQQALDHINDRDEKLKTQRLHLAVRLRKRRNTIPRAGGDTGELAARRRELENVRQCLEATEVALVRRWARPWGVAIALLACVALLLTTVVSHAVASRWVKPIVRATMIVQMPDAQRAATLIESPGPGLQATPRPNFRVLLTSDSFHEDGALAPLTPIIRMMAAERKTAGPFAASSPAAQVVQPPTTEIMTNDPAIWRLTGRLSAYGLILMIALMSAVMAMLRKSRRVMDDALRAQLTDLLTRRRGSTSPTAGNPYEPRVL